MCGKIRIFGPNVVLSYYLYLMSKAMENFRPTLLRRQALDALRGRWTPAAIAGLAMFVTIAVFSGIAQIPYVGFVGNLLNLFVGAFVCMGGYFLFWDMLRGEDADMKKLGEPFGTMRGI